MALIGVLVLILVVGVLQRDRLDQGAEVCEHISGHIKPEEDDEAMLEQRSCTALIAEYIGPPVLVGSVSINTLLTGTDVLGNKIVRSNEKLLSITFIGDPITLLF